MVSAVWFFLVFSSACREATDEYFLFWFEGGPWGRPARSLMYFFFFETHYKLTCGRTNFFMCVDFFVAQTSIQNHHTNFRNCFLGELCTVFNPKKTSDHVRHAHGAVPAKC